METTMTDNGFNVSFNADEIVHVSISANSDYNSASIVVKPAQDEYFDCYYSWKGSDNIPTFVLEIMSFIKRNTEQSGELTKGTVYKNEELYKDYLEFINKSDKGD